MTSELTFIILLGILLLIGVPLLTTSLMKLYWKIAGRKNGVTKKASKESIPFLSILIFSIIALLLLFYLLSILLDGSLLPFN